MLSVIFFFGKKGRSSSYDSQLENKHIAVVADDVHNSLRDDEKVFSEGSERKNVRKLRKKGLEMEERCERLNGEFFVKLRNLDRRSEKFDGIHEA